MSAFVGEITAVIGVYLIALWAFHRKSLFFLGFTLIVLDGGMGWIGAAELPRPKTGIVSPSHLTPTDHGSENISIQPVVISELKLSNVQRQIFVTYFVDCPRHAALEIDQKPSNVLVWTAPTTLARPYCSFCKSVSTSCSLDRLASANPAMRESKSC